jgi:hypothetical protein
MRMKNTVELRAITRMNDGSEAIQTGIYVFEDTTIKEVKELMMRNVRNLRVDSVEFDIYDKEED